MRKRIIARSLYNPNADQAWLDVENTTSVEVTSEGNSFPIESALLQPEKGGWRAAETGVQVIWLIFEAATMASTHKRCVRGDREQAHTRIQPEMVL